MLGNWTRDLYGYRTYDVYAGASVLSLCNLHKLITQLHTSVSICVHDIHFYRFSLQYIYVVAAIRFSSQHRILKF